MSNYAKHTATRTHGKPVKTSQRLPIPGTNQIKNNAGGYVWDAGDWVRLDRFLILGSEGGNYYSSEKALTVANAAAALRCIQEDGMRVVNRVVEISDAGRAAKNDPAIFVLALCASSPDDTTRRAALAAMNKVVRTGTHLFTFLETVQSFRGWGRGLVRAVQKWYDDKTVDSVAYQAIKYRQRNGWTHRDVLRLSHPAPDHGVRNALYNWIVKGTSNEIVVANVGIVDGFLKVQEAKDAKAAAELIREYNLPREAVPTQFLKDKNVWQALLAHMPLTAMIRNLGNMGAAGVLAPGEFDTIKFVGDKLCNVDELRKARIHPISILVALVTYQQGHGTLGSNSWPVLPVIVDVLNAAFYASFANVEKTGKRYMLGLDVSGSMSSKVSGVEGLSCAMATAAMAMVTARTEDKYVIQAFSHTLVPLNITPSMDLNTVMRMTRDMNFGGTDASLPIRYAREKKIAVDVFVIYTDNETWAGETHAAQELARYRQEMGIPAKLAVVGMSPNGYTIAEPEDEGSLNLVGFDTSTPQALNQFVSM